MSTDDATQGRVLAPAPGSGQGRGTGAARPRPSPGRVAVLLAVLGLDLLVLSALPRIFGDGSWFLGGAVLLCVVGLTVAVVVPGLVALRWLSPGLVLLVLFTLAPMVYTGYVAFTNYSSDHLLTKQQAVRSLAQDIYLPPDAPTYQWKAYADPAGTLALYLVPKEGPARFAVAGGQVREVTPPTPGSTEGLPATLDGFTQLSTVEAVSKLSVLSQTTFGSDGDTFKVTSLDRAGGYQSKYAYDAGSDTVTDRATGTVYRPVEGTFTADDGKQLAPSFQAFNGLANVKNLVTTPSIAGPVLKIFVWTIVYAVSVVAIQFVVGLVIALALNDSSIGTRLAKAIRSVLLLPYVIPAYLSILIWAAMFNQQLGVLPRWVEALTGLDPGWVGTPNGARLIAIVVTLWLGFPYFLLIISGALQAIPADLLEAAQVDGGTAVQRFREIVFPMLLRMVGPLTVLAFAYNFNNFLVVYILNNGGPAMPDATVPAGSSDLLISFTYKLGFSFGSSQYGLAAVITMVIFAILIPVVVSQFRYYAVWQEEDR